MILYKILKWTFFLLGSLLFTKSFFMQCIDQVVWWLLEPLALKVLTIRAAFGRRIPLARCLRVDGWTSEDLKMKLWIKTWKQQQLKKKHYEMKRSKLKWYHTADLQISILPRFVLDVAMFGRSRQCQRFELVELLWSHIIEQWLSLGVTTTLGLGDEEVNKSYNQLHIILYTLHI